MNLYSVLEVALIGLIGIVSVYHVMKTMMPRVVHGARASVVLRLGRGVGAASWRRALAVKVHEVRPQPDCGAGCGSGCNGCSVAVQAGKPLPTDDQPVR
ncbi:MAG: hypothetical protein JSU95_12985 [Betaproteobacteria bacterium]|nr:MAG: hypothetical protein JSU95_12985 [Betaproteobacteria bacterium]